MRFHSDGPSIPDILLERCDAGRVVFLCGAGVSQPSGMPTFVGLTKHVIEFFDPPADSDIMAAFRPWRDGQSAGNVPLDQIFNLLHLEYGKDEVNALVTERLRAPLGTKEFGREHDLIKRISSSPSGKPQIVTTNFDLLFEARTATRLALHVPPAFPDLNYGSTIEGITYLHGRLVDPDSEYHSYVLSSADFGRAYLSEGWATNFIRHLLEQYTVVLVGYQAEDPPVKYLLQGLNHDGQYDRSKLYAFDRGLPEEIEAKWRDRGVTSIAYSNHADLWKSLEAWADRADDTRKWRSDVIAKCQHDPKDLLPHERGQVAHVLRTVQGARLFSEADPMPHPEWVCVLDANIRSAKPSRGYGDNAETFEPAEMYGIDNDRRDISEDERKQGIHNDDLLIWLDGDESPHEFHRLGGAFGTVPKRLSHLISWVCKSIESPVMAWWAIRQNGLHPRLLQQLEWRLEHSKTLSKRARHIWTLIIEHHRDDRNNQWNDEWFKLKKQVEANGWDASNLRAFRKIAAPRLEIRTPYGLRSSRPPSACWESVQLADLGQFEVAFLKRHNEELDLTDDSLPSIFSIIEDQLVVASGLLADIETAYFRSPTCYPDRDVDGRGYVTDADEFVMWFVRLFDRLTNSWPKLAHAHATTWPATDQFFFRKLRLYAFNKKGVFAADQVANEVLSLSQGTFWDYNVARELLFLLVDRWAEFSKEHQELIAKRILAGPDQPSHLSNEEFSRLRDEYSARYGRYLELQGCALSDEHSGQISDIIRAIPKWSDGWATSLVNARGASGGWVTTDENPNAVLHVPLNQVIAKAKDDLKRDFESLTDKRPFTGLVRANPRKALSALTLAGKSGDFPITFWSSMINDIPQEITPRLRRVFLHRVTRLPHKVIADLAHVLGRWLEQNLTSVLEFDHCLSWGLYDHFVDSLFTAGAGATNSGLGEVQQGGKVITRSRRTFDHAINGPIGMCAEALFRAVPGETQEAGSLIPCHIKSRVERLLATPGEGPDHVASVIGSKLNWLLFVDPNWTESQIIPMLAFDHPASEPTWNGFLYNQRAPSQVLATKIKPLLLQVFPWIEQFSWDHELFGTAAQWLGFMRVFHADEEGGLSRVEMRSALRAMSDETRNRFIYWLGRVGQKNENGWATHVIPLIKEDWPREHRYRTSASIRAWVGLLDDTGVSFAAVYDAVKIFLVPVETNDHPFYRFTRELRDEQAITSQFPEAVLDLMNRVTPQTLSRPPYELPMVLEIIAESEPKLLSDQRYLRLINLVEQS